MIWVLFDYGGVICTPQPDSDVARLASAAGVPVAAFCDAYWAHRLDYDRAELDGTTYWQMVAAGAGRSFTPAQVAELIRLDIASWLHLRAGIVTLIEDLATAGYRLALLSNAPAEVADVVAGLPGAAHYEHCAYSHSRRSGKPEPQCYRAVQAKLGAGPADVVFLDDKPDNVAGAQALGIRSVQFTEPAQARAALAAYGVVTTPRS